MALKDLRWPAFYLLFLWRSSWQVITQQIKAAGFNPFPPFYFFLNRKPCPAGQSWKKKNYKKVKEKKWQHPVYIMSCCKAERRASTRWTAATYITSTQTTQAVAGQWFRPAVRKGSALKHRTRPIGLSHLSSTKPHLCRLGPATTF